MTRSLRTVVLVALLAVLEKLRLKREELVQRDELVSRAKVARARIQVQQVAANVSVLDPTSELRRWEDRLRHEEARAQGMADVSRGSLDDQFAQLDSENDEKELESRFAALKSGG
jgi:phage shock protein A